MAQKHLEQVLTAAGLPAEKVTELMGLAEDHADFKPEGYVEPVHKTVETKVINNPEFYAKISKESIPKEFLKQLEGEQYGRVANIVRDTMLKATGLSLEDFKELGDDGKKIEVFTPAFVKKLNKGEISVQDLQKKLMEANTEVERLKGLEPELDKKYKGQYDGQVAEFQFNGGVLAHLASVQGLTAPARYIVNDIASQLKAQYAFAIVNGAPVLRQKANPELAVLINNGTQELTLGAAINKILTDDNLITKDKKLDKSSGGEKIDVGPEGGKLKMSKNVESKINKRIEEDKKLAGNK